MIPKTVNYWSNGIGRDSYIYTMSSSLFLNTIYFLFLLKFTNLTGSSERK